MPPLYLHNSLTNKTETFAPRTAGEVSLYVCGPTVYDAVHVGNARPAVVFDTLYRLLRRRYPRVRYARNITDIDDKIIAAAEANGETAAAVAARWQQQYLDDMTRLGVLPPTAQPLATAYIPQMVAMITTLIKKKFAYHAQGHVLFHVPSYKHYGELSNRQRDEMVAGARVEVAPYKRDPADFVLWKPSTATQPGWDSPWGRGRPGWHIECSAMAAACLGEEIDIHGGGQDLIFPHHENEIAQSCCAHGTRTFARYWVHNGFVRLEGEKMAKSRRNVQVLRTVLARYPGECVRLALLGAHYRQPLNWTQSLLDNSRAVLNRWYRLLDGDMTAADVDDDDAVTAALANDLNTPEAIASLHAQARAISHESDDATAATLRGQFVAAAQCLGLLCQTPREWFHHAANADGDSEMTLTEAEITEQIAKRQEARAAKDFATADAIRQQLEQRGIVLEDAAGETHWRRK